MDFSTLNLHSSIFEGIVSAGYRAPTPIQQQSIPLALKGKDLLGLAQTGTGKTAAFVLPILQRLHAAPRGIVRALIIAPTRELADQINTCIQQLGAKTGVKSTVIYGGVGVTPQVQRLKQGVDIVVACPGRLLEHIQEKTINLQKLEVLVLDEADQMFDMGFFPTIRKILKVLPTNRQTMFFSATMPSDIRRLSMEVLQNPVSVQIDIAQPVSTITHAVYEIASQKRGDLLFELLQGTTVQSALIFTRTKHGAKRLAQQLQAVGMKATSLQGNLSQGRRQEAIEGFRTGTYKVMVATDIAARGIDVSKVSHVINFDVPSTVETYTHRIGRTGRALRTGEAITFATPEDAHMIRQIEKSLGMKLPRKMIQFEENKIGKPKVSLPRHEEPRQRSSFKRPEGQKRSSERRWRAV